MYGSHDYFDMYMYGSPDYFVKYVIFKYCVPFLK